MPVERFCAVVFKFRVAGLCWILLFSEEMAVVFQVRCWLLSSLLKKVFIIIQFGLNFI